MKNQQHKSLVKKPKKMVTQSTTLSENDDNYHDENSPLGESSYIQQKPKKSESYSSSLMNISKNSQNTNYPSSIIDHNDKQGK